MSDDKIIRLGEKREHTPKADSEPKDKEESKGFEPIYCSFCRKAKHAGLKNGERSRG